MPDTPEVDRKTFVPLTEDGIDRSPEAMEQRRQRIAAMLPTPPASQAPAAMCPECIPPKWLTRIGKNRLSDCGHMRWTQKGWQAKGAGKRVTRKDESSKPVLVADVIKHLEFLWSEIERAKESGRKAQKFLEEAEAQYREYCNAITAK
jgi:hypothetical protein